MLLVRRANPPSVGSWSLPGGKVELGESSLQTASRELFEETNLGSKNAGVVFVPRAISASDVIVPDSASKGGYAFHYSIVQHVAFIREADDALAEQEGRAQDDASDLRWFTLQELKAGSLTIGGDVVGVLEWVQTLIASGCIVPHDAKQLDHF